MVLPISCVANNLPRKPDVEVVPAARSETGDIDIVYADESLAALWETSAAAKAEMADQLPLVRRAVRAPGSLMLLVKVALQPLTPWLRTFTFTSPQVTT